MEPVLSLENVSKFYTSSSNVVMGLNGVNLRFSRGEFVAITGESGSGKTTLSSVLGGILPYESGEMFFDGKPTSHFDGGDWERYRRDHISFVHQNYGILPGTSVLMNVVCALRLSGLKKRDAKRRANEILRQVDLWSLRHRRAAKLSSGQKQRLSIARALAKPTPILIADEPTGNLDPENSAKVISLLAEAAKTRLVILVTHEFSEVEQYVSRHIRLQDGSVTLDSYLRPANTPEPLPTVKKTRVRGMSGYVARLQLSSRPVWSTLLTLLFALTAFAVFAFLGSFIIALDDTDTRIYDDSSFLNGDKNRIVVSTLEGRPMDQQDYDAIVALEHVNSLETNGYVTDAQYSYRQGVDYTIVYKENVDPMTLTHYMTSSHSVMPDAPFLKTVPVLPEGQEFLKTGKLPESFYQIVAHTDTGLEIGERVSVCLFHRNYWSTNTSLMLTFTVVGITDHGSDLYFSQDMGRFFQQVIHGDGDAAYYQFIPEPEQPSAQYYAIKDRLPSDYSPFLEDGQCRVHESVLATGLYETGLNNRAFFYFADVNLLEQGLDPTNADNLVQLVTPEQHILVDGEVLAISYDPRSHQTPWFSRLVHVNQNTFRQMTWQLASEQVSITISDYAYTDRVIDKLGDMGYIAASPFRLGSTKVDAQKAVHRYQTLGICLGALIAVIALQIVLMKVMFSAENESYRLLSSIGLTRKPAMWSVLWQFIFFTVLGQLLGAGALVVCAWQGIERIQHLFRYLPAGYLALLSGIHLAAALVAALWVSRSLRAQVFTFGSRFCDLDLDEKEDAV